MDTIQEIITSPRIEGVYLLFKEKKHYDFSRREWITERLFYVGESINVHVRFGQHLGYGRLQNSRMLLLQETKGLKTVGRRRLEWKFMIAAYRLGLTIVNVNGAVSCAKNDAEDVTEQIGRLKEALIFLGIESQQIAA